MGDSFTIADITIFPWVRDLLEFYKAGNLVKIDKHPNAQLGAAPKAVPGEIAILAGTTVASGKSLTDKRRPSQYACLQSSFPDLTSGANSGTIL